VASQSTARRPAGALNCALIAPLSLEPLLVAEFSQLLRMIEFSQYFLQQP
jgi:hypothetical protein